MKRVAGRQTRYVNKLEKRTGSLWEGRFKSSLISSKEYLPACCRYIELNPLRAGLVTDPTHYKWSSYAAKVIGKKNPVVMIIRSICLWERTHKKGKKLMQNMCWALCRSMNLSSYEMLYNGDN